MRSSKTKESSINFREWKDYRIKDNHGNSDKVAIRIISRIVEGMPRTASSKDTIDHPDSIGGQEGTLGSHSTFMTPATHCPVKGDGEREGMFNQIEFLKKYGLNDLSCNISYKCIYDNNGNELITENTKIKEYDFSLYISSNSILEVRFIISNNDVFKEKLSLNFCLSCIYDLMLHTIEKSSIDDKWFDSLFLTLEARSVTNDVKEAFNPTQIQLICCKGLKDFAAFSDFNSIIKGITEMNNSCVTFKNLKRSIPCVHNEEYAHHCSISIRDINLYNDDASYDTATDILKYGSKLFGKNIMWLATIPSLSEKIAKNELGDYLCVSRNKNGKLDDKEFDRIWKGKHTVSKGRSEDGKQICTAVEPVNDEANCLQGIATLGYFGGYNDCPTPGIYKNVHTYDWDIRQAYLVGLSMIPDIDYSDPIEKEFKRGHVLHLKDFSSPIDMMFCCVDFEFPKGIKYASIPIRNEDSICFPLKAQNAYAAGPDLYLALKLGCKITVRRGYKARILKRDGKLSMSLLHLCQKMYTMICEVKDRYGEESDEAKLAKLIANTGYGKISQAVIEKRLWNMRTRKMENLEPSEITSPERAAMVTSIIRAMLIGTVTDLQDRGIRSYSVTTDGFISEATKEQLDACDAFGFTEVFRNARMAISGSEEIWKQKHEQEILLNPTTRCNVGFGVNNEKGVLAHGGYCTGAVKDSEEDRMLMAKTIVTRDKDTSYRFISRTSIKEMVSRKASYMEAYQTRKSPLSYDFKRKPIWESAYDEEVLIGDVAYKYVCFETEPFESVEEYILVRKAAKAMPCIRTLEDMKLLKLRLDGKTKGVRMDLSDMARTKLMSVIKGYRLGMWDIPELTACKTLEDKLAIINKHNHSDQPYSINDWKNARRKDRAGSMLPVEELQELLQEFGVAC